MRIVRTVPAWMLSSPFVGVIEPSEKPAATPKQNPPPVIQGMLPRHVAELVASGLTEETIARSGIKSVTNQSELAKLIRWKGRTPTEMGAAIAFPFADIKTRCFGDFARLKFDNPRTEESDDDKPHRVFKYEQPKGRSNRIYFPPEAIDAVTAPGAAIGITEGEKKALAATQSGLPTISVSGIWGWQVKRKRDSNNKPIGERKLIDDLAQVDWKSRPVWIGFDFDAKRNPHVHHAAAELARVLHEHGADVTIIAMPAGPRDEHGNLTKMALDDYLVHHGAVALRRLINSQVWPETINKTLAQWRDELELARIDSLRRHEVNLCRSTTGAGKSYADTAAMKSTSTSLIVLPTHKNCQEFEATCVSVDVPAVAYPPMNKETCQNYATAEKAMDHGLSPSQAICPSCPFRDSCDYHDLVGLAEQSRHKICTHHRGAMSFEQIADGQDYISIHEEAAEFMRPGLQVAAGLDDVRAVSDAAVGIVRRSYIGANPDRSEEYFFHLMGETAASLSDAMRSEKSEQLKLPTATRVPRSCDQRLWEAMQLTGVWPSSDPLRMVKSLAAGEICELVVRVDKVHSPTGEIKKTHKSICAVKQTKLPTKSTIWMADATADKEDIESLLGGRQLIDKTPSGELERKHPVFQVLTDVKKSTSKNKVAGIIRGLLRQLSHQRIGVICHRSHVATIQAEGGDRITRIDYFFGSESRGSNAWIEDCDCLVVVGTPRVPPETIKNRLLKLGLFAAMVRDETEVEWKRDYWSAITNQGRRVTVQSLAYRDHDWHRAHRNIVQAEIRQAIGRGRAVTESGVPVLVLTNEDLGLPVLEIAADSLTSSEQEILSAMRKIIRDQENTESEAADLSEHFPTEKLSEQNPIYIIGKCSVSSLAISEAISKSDRLVRRTLNTLQDKGFVNRIGERGGWRLLESKTLDLRTISAL